MTRFDCFELWLALGCPQSQFDPWFDQERMTLEDAWAQLLATVKGSVWSLAMDTNPPVSPYLLDAARQRAQP